MYESKEDIIKLKLEIEELKNKNQLLEEKLKEWRHNAYIKRKEKMSTIRINLKYIYYNLFELFNKLPFI